MMHAFLLAVVLSSASPAPADSVRAAQEIRETILRHTSDVRRCYQSEGLRRNPSLSGAVELELTILPTGRVDNAAVLATSLVGPGVPEVSTCLTTTARNWRFGRGPYAVETVVFPFVFSPERGPLTAEIAVGEER